MSHERPHFHNEQENEFARKNYYERLGLARTASEDEINSAFRDLAKQHHPDIGGDVADFQYISEAHSVLKDSAKRRAYDVTLPNLGDTNFTSMNPMSRQSSTRSGPDAPKEAPQSFRRASSFTHREREDDYLEREVKKLDWDKMKKNIYEDIRKRADAMGIETFDEFKKTELAGEWIVRLDYEMTAKEKERLASLKKGILEERPS